MRLPLISLILISSVNLILSTQIYLDDNDAVQAPIPDWLDDLETPFLHSEDLNENLGFPMKNEHHLPGNIFRYHFITNMSSFQYYATEILAASI